MTLGLVAAATVPAQAEGSWNSSVSGGSIGAFSSRWWPDNAIDSASTGVRFSQCSGIPVAMAHLNVGLFRDNGLFPDHSHGTVANACSNNYSYWGSFPAGSFRWQLMSVKLASGPTTTGYTVNIGSLTTAY